MRRPTLDDVAERAGVSRTLVSVTLRGMPGARDYTKGLIHQAVNDLGYVPHTGASDLASQSSRAIGVFMSDLHNPFFADIVDGFHWPMRESNFHILMGMGDQPDLERSVLEMFRSYRMAGAMLIGPGIRERELEEFGKAIPTVVIARKLRTTAVDVIVGDDRKGARLAVEHLYELGHRDIAHLDGGSLPAAAAARRTGYLGAMRRLGLEKYVRVAGGGFTLAHGADGVDELLKTRPPSAIFAANDLVAMGAIERLATLGLTTPNDISIVGYDNSNLAAQQRLGLTSIDQPRLQIGELAATLLSERFAGRTTASRHILMPKLVERSSTARRRSGRRRGINGARF